MWNRVQDDLKLVRVQNIFTLCSPEEANSFCFSPVPSARSHAPSVGATAPAPNPPQVVMSVEDFYYGSFGGDLSQRGPQAGIKTSVFNCSICSHQAQNNLR